MGCVHRRCVFALLLTITRYFSIAPLSAEQLPTFDIAYLALHCSDVWEAEPLRVDSAFIFNKNTSTANDQWLQLRITAMYRSSNFQVGDTVWVHTSAGLYYWTGMQPIQHLGHEYNCSSDTIQRLLVFSNVIPAEQLSERFDYPLSRSQHFCTELYLSGLRLLGDNGHIFYPLQTDVPGGYNFFCAQKLRWMDLQTFTYQEISRADTLLNLRKIENKATQNKALFAWINSHIGQLRTADYTTGNWYWYRDLPFEWIFYNGVREQAFEAVQLHHQIYPLEILNYADNEIVYADKIYPFQETQGKDFLWQKLRDSICACDEQAIALYFLSENVYEEGLTLSLRQELFAVFKNQFYQKCRNRERNLAFLLTHKLALYNYPAQEMLPDAYPLYRQFYEEIPPGEKRHGLAHILAKYGTAAEWQAISGNMGRMVAVIFPYRYDSIAQVIKLSFYQYFGEAALYETPRLEMYQLDSSGQKIHRQDLPFPPGSPTVDWDTGSLPMTHTLSLDIPVHGLPHGQWYFRAYGSAGAEQQFSWQSDTIDFRW